MVVGYLTLQDLFSWEPTSKALRNSVQDAPQYKALIAGWEDRIPHSKNKKAKEKFLYLNANVPGFKVHIANLGFNFFPLEGQKLPLSHYWEFTNFPAVGKLLNNLNKVYDGYLSSSVQQPEFTRSAILGAAITSSKVDTSNPNSTNIQRLKKLDKIYRDEAFSKEQRNTARYNWIEHTVKHALVEPTTPPLVYTAEEARRDYKALLDDHHTPVQVQLSVRYHLAELDIKGFGLHQPDLTAAKEELLIVSSHPNIHPFTKILANKYLSIISKGEK